MSKSKETLRELLVKYQDGGESWRDAHPDDYVSLVCPLCGHDHSDHDDEESQEIFVAELEQFATAESDRRLTEFAEELKGKLYMMSDTEIATAEMVDRAEMYGYNRGTNDAHYAIDATLQRYIGESDGK